MSEAQKKKYRRNVRQFALSLLVLGSVLHSTSLFAAVIAHVGSKDITTEEIKAEFENMNGEQRKAINEDAFTKKSIVENVVNSEMLVQAAQKSGLENDAEYKRAMDRFRRQFLATKFMQKTIEPKLAKGEIKKYYDGNKNLFDTTQVCAQHVVLSEQQAAEKLMAQAKAKDANFEELAKKNSIDPTVQENKGSLGCFTREKMVPEFADAAFKMRKGEVRGPVRTMYGYHIIKVTDVKPGQVPGFEEVEQRVKEIYRVKLVQELLGDLRAKSKVKIEEDELRKFKL